jgi:hypothetical protein
MVELQTYIFHSLYRDSSPIITEKDHCRHPPATKPRSWMGVILSKWEEPRSCRCVQHEVLTWKVPDWKVANFMETLTTVFQWLTGHWRDESLVGNGRQSLPMPLTRGPGAHWQIFMKSSAAGYLDKFCLCFQSLSEFENLI